MRMQIHGARTLGEEVIIEIVPTLCPSDEEITSDAEKLYQIIRSYLPFRTFAILREKMRRDEARRDRNNQRT